MILALGYLLAAFLSPWSAMTLEAANAHATPKGKPSAIMRTVSESNFILYDYGVWIEPKKLGRRERLALALTRLTDPDQ